MLNHYYTKVFQELLFKVADGSLSQIFRIRMQKIKAALQVLKKRIEHFLVVKIILGLLKQFQVQSHQKVQLYILKFPSKLDFEVLICYD